ncbi:epoxide hydrolase 1-like [Salvelinus namaycush]|uniref:Epoxide hydrolase n=1 Tax=Salvelinus namaycush TaxID=8040 RepID=A0A8U0PSH8_SALNM|nr:epoxide hydrolase 1-like [Salvelinus namaycush]
MQTIEVLKQALSSLDPTQQQQLLVAGSAVAVGGLLTCYYWVYQGMKAKRIPIGGGWWGAGEKPQSEDEKVFPFQVQTSDEEIQTLQIHSTTTTLIIPIQTLQIHSSTTILIIPVQNLHICKYRRVTVAFPNLAPGDSKVCVKGLHLNMLTSKLRGFGVLFSILIGRYVPWLVGFTREDVRRLFGSVGFMERNIYEIIRETGYLHIQGTKPDSAGCGLNDSPVGLAAYILDKFSTWTDFNNRDLEDGGLERKFTLDDLLTNIMIYWTTGSIVSSMRFYKENLKTNIENRLDNKACPYAAFPNELMHVPQSWARDRFRNIYSYSYMPRGGHFAAFEEPQLLADDLLQFVKKVEKL